MASADAPALVTIPIAVILVRQSVMERTPALCVQLVVRFNAATHAAQSSAVNHAHLVRKKTVHLAVLIQRVACLVQHLATGSHALIDARRLYAVAVSALHSAAQLAQMPASASGARPTTSRS